jgi:hypothetical protein
MCPVSHPPAPQGASWSLTLPVGRSSSFPPARASGARSRSFPWAGSRWALVLREACAGVCPPPCSRAYQGRRFLASRARPALRSGWAAPSLDTRVAPGIRLGGGGHTHKPALAKAASADGRPRSATQKCPGELPVRGLPVIYPRVGKRAGAVFFFLSSSRVEILTAFSPRA